MQRPDTDRWTRARRFVAGTAVVFAAVVWTHGLAGVLRYLGDPGAPPAALALTVAALGVAKRHAAGYETVTRSISAPSAR